MAAPKGNNNAGKGKPGITPVAFNTTLSQEATVLAIRAYTREYKQQPTVKELRDYLRRIARSELKYRLEVLAHADGNGEEKPG